MILDLLQATALLLALCLLQGGLARRCAHGGPAFAVGSGLIYGLACIAGMMMPITLAPGVIVDPRSVVLSVGALFGGPLAGAVAGLAAAAYRIWLGGSGVFIGVTTITLAVLLGLAFRLGAARGWLRPAPLQLFLFGVFTHATSLLLIATVPNQSLAGLFANLGLPYLLLMGAATLLLGALLRDLEQRRATECALAASEARLRAITAAIPDLVFVVDEDGRYLEVITRQEDLLAAPPAQVIGRRFEEVLPAGPAAVLREALAQALASPERTCARYALDTPAGRREFQAWIQAIDAPIGGRRAAAILVQDITANVESEERIRRLAYYDPLTELPNRRLLVERLGHAIATNARTGLHGALIFIDLDDFKNINDLLGHHNGDLLLREAGARLRGVVRESDTVARLGGDEFVVLLELLAESADEALLAARQVADKLLEQLGRPYRLDGLDRKCTASLGLVIFNGHEHTADELMQRADLSMYEAKRSGKNTARVFDPHMRTELADRLALEAELRGALGTGAFLIHLQPQLDAGGRLIGAEALLRWNRIGCGMDAAGPVHPARRAGGPDARARARSDGARLRGARTLGRAARRHRSGDGGQHQRSPALRARLRRGGPRLLARTGAPAERLKLELTESLLLTDIERAIEAMTRLREMGIRFSIDDFGTGYSSLGYLQRLPLDELKIDRAFVRDLPANASSLAIVRTIMALAATLRIRVIAEGVETSAQHACLLDNGCDAFQGFLFARPEPVETFRARLAAGAARESSTETRVGADPCR
jgi:diguanylate cyclase (GGDEF)-like protein/PAS domain S-box-containing protein